MDHRMIWQSLVSWLVLGITLTAQVPALAQETPLAPKWAYAFDLSAREVGKQVFDDETKKYGVEVFKDDNNNFGVFIAQTGEISIVNDFSNVKTPLENSVAPKWKAGYDLKARKAGETEFSDKTKVWAMEVFWDENTNNWIYITQNGKLAVVPGKNPTGGAVAPQWSHAMDLNCRKGGIDDWEKGNKYGVEVYKDLNNGNLIYIVGETGAIAVVPGEGTDEPEQKDPEWLHGLDLKCRKAGVPNFDKETNVYGVEIFRDNSTNNFLFISHVGDIDVVPGAKDASAPTKDPRSPKFTHGLDLQCRKAGELDFTPETKTFALEIFEDPNLDLTIYIDEIGMIAVAPIKK